MSDFDTIKRELEKPLDRKHVAQRSQSGRSLSYVEGWHVIAEANRIFGFNGWTRETLEMREVRGAELVKNSNGKETWRVGYVAKVRVTALGVTREGTGFGAGALPDLGEAYESAIKEAETDAMKRALMTFGNPFGLALYDKTQSNVVTGNKVVNPDTGRMVNPGSANQLRKPGGPWEKMMGEIAECEDFDALRSARAWWLNEAEQVGWNATFVEEMKEQFHIARQRLEGPVAEANGYAQAAGRA